MFTALLSVLTVLALFNRRAFPYACVLVANWIGTDILQRYDLWTWMPVLDGAAFYGLLGVWIYRPLTRGVVCLALSALTLAAHAAYYWPQPEGVYYGLEYMYALQGLFLIAMAVLALGDFNARSVVGIVREGFRGFSRRRARVGFARDAAVSRKK